MGGYEFRGNPILGVVQGKYVNVSDLDTTFTVLSYANGPGGLKRIRTTNLTNEQTEKDHYVSESLVPLNSETHGGEDVAIFAKGPMSFLFEGTVEQSYIGFFILFLFFFISHKNNPFKFISSTPI
jgi:alkaline phosphatase